MEFLYLAECRLKVTEVNLDRVIDHSRILILNMDIENDSEHLIEPLSARDANERIAL